MAFHDVRFPDKILRGAVGGPKWNTTVGTTDTGFEQRNQNWSASRRSWVVARRIVRESDLRDLLDFFQCRSGKAHGFLFRDPSDYYVGLSHTPGTGMVHAGAHNFATGNASATVYQLTKRYSSGGVTVDRKITRPLDPGRADAPDNAVAIKVYLAGVDQPTGWSLNYATGVLTFTSPPGNGVAIGWGGMFDIPARFDTDEAELDIDAMFAAKWSGLPIIEIRE